MAIGLLVLRLVFGTLLIGHGTQKVFGWFGGHGPEATGGFFHSMGFRPGKPMAYLAGAAEAGGGLFLLLGLLTPLAAVAIVGTLVVASSVHYPKLWVTDGGFEPALLFSTAALALAFAGPGRYSLDHAIGLTSFAGTGWGVAVLVVGLLSGLLVVARAKSTLRSEQAAPQEDLVSA